MRFRDPEPGTVSSKAQGMKLEAEDKGSVSPVHPQTCLLASGWAAEVSFLSGLGSR